MDVEYYYKEERGRVSYRLAEAGIVGSKSTRTRVVWIMT